MLLEYHFKIEYIKGTNNIKADVLSQKAKLQRLKKLLGTMLKLYENKKIKYNYLKLAAT